MLFVQFPGGFFDVAADVSHNLSDAVIPTTHGVQQMRRENAVFAVVPFVCGLSLFAGIENRDIRDKFRFCFFSFQNNVSSGVFYNLLVRGGERFFFSPFSIVYSLAAIQNQAGVLRPNFRQLVNQVVKRNTQQFNIVWRDV